MASAAPLLALLEDRVADTTVRVIHSHILRYLETKDFARAISWLERCEVILQNCSLPAARETKIAILSSLIRSYLARNVELDLSTAGGLLNKAVQEHPTSGWCFLLRLEYVSARHPKDYQAWLTQLTSTIRIVQFDEESWSGLLSKIHDVQAHDLDIACQATDAALQKLITSVETNIAWVERAIMNRVWMTTNFPFNQHEASLEKLETIMTAVHAKIDRSLGARATHSVQVVYFQGIVLIVAHLESL